VTTPPTGARRLQRRRASSVHLIMLIAGIVGLVLTLGLLREDALGHRVAVAVRDIEPGAVLKRTDVRFERVSADARVLSRLVPAANVRAMQGRIVTAAIAKDEPLLVARLRLPAASDGRRAMSIPVERARAVNGRLVPGDRVDVVVADRGTAAIVVAAAEVLDVEADDGSFGSRRDVSVTLAVDARESQLLTAALASGDFVLTRVTGASSAAGVQPVAVSGASG
jgi:Flp pilus assembly protein CpaB